MFDALSLETDGDIKRLNDSSIIAEIQSSIGKGQPNQTLKRNLEYLARNI
jgi:hypothetical protein